jgi:hypothetical protein
MDTLTQNGGIELPQRGGRCRWPRPHWKTHDLRARTVRLVRSGLDLMRGGYIRLLSGRHRRR